MSPAVLDAPRGGPGSLFATAPRGRAAGGRRATLEELLEGAWRSVRSDGEAECPVCHAAMHRAAGRARCEGCGATLA
jgi:hypothetical protein